MTGSRAYEPVMLTALLADHGVSISALKKNPSAVIAAAEGAAVAILNRNTPAAYLIPAAAYEALLEALDDIELVRIVREREGEIGVEVSIDDL